MVAEEKLKRLPYWNLLTEREKPYVASNSNEVSYTKGALLFSHDMSCLGMIYILSGRLRVITVSGEGREITLFHLQKDDYCIFSASCAFNEVSIELQLIADEDTRIITVNPRSYSSLMEKNPDVRCFTYELMIKRLTTIIWVMQEIIFNRIDSRLARYLIQICTRSGSNEILITQEQIAADINSAREVITRMLKSFSADGLVEIKRGSILIRNIGELYRIAGISTDQKEN